MGKKIRGLRRCTQRDCMLPLNRDKNGATNIGPVRWSQLHSREVQLGVADEIIARVHEKAAEIEAGNGRGA